LGIFQEGAELEPTIWVRVEKSEIKAKINHTLKSIVNVDVNCSNFHQRVVIIERVKRQREFKIGQSRGEKLDNQIFLRPIFDTDFLRTILWDSPQIPKNILYGSSSY